MRLHPRYRTVVDAESELRTTYLDIVQRYGLTYPEGMGMLARLIESDAKYAIREERHGADSDLKGDEDAD